MIGTLQKSFLKECLPPFLLGLGVFVFLLVMSQILRISELIIVHGVNLIDIGRLFFFLMSSFFAICLPIAFLFSLLAVLGRWSADSELTAMFAGGKSLLHLILPASLFGVVIAAFCLFCTIFLESWGYSSFKKVVFQIGKNKVSVGIQEGVFNDDFYGMVLYTEKLHPSEMKLEKIFIYDEREKGHPFTVLASEGYILAPENLPSPVLRLYRGSIHKSDEKSYEKVEFQTYDIRLSLEELFFKEKERKPNLVSFPLLLQRLQEYKTQDPPLYWEYLMEFHRRFAVAGAPLSLLLLAMALGATSRKSIRAAAFLWTLLLIGAYWTLYLLLKRWVTHSGLSPAMAMWLPNLIFLILGIYFFTRANRR